MADESVISAAGSLPAAKGKRAAAYSKLSARVAEVFPDNPVAWGVLDEMAGATVYADSPRGTTTANRVADDVAVFFEKLEKTPGLDIAAEIEALRIQLQRDLG
jgi:hypothetical protein